MREHSKGAVAQNVRLIWEIASGLAGYVGGVRAKQSGNQSRNADWEQALLPKCPEKESVLCSTDNEG